MIIELNNLFTKFYTEKKRKNKADLHKEDLELNSLDMEKLLDILPPNSKQYNRFIKSYLNILITKEVILNVIVN